MLERLKKRITSFFATLSFFITIYGNKVLAVTTPNEDEVNEIASKGLKIFFGALAGFAVIMGGIELYGAFMTHRCYYYWLCIIFSWNKKYWYCYC